MVKVTRERENPDEHPQEGLGAAAILTSSTKGLEGGCQDARRYQGGLFSIAMRRMEATINEVAILDVVGAS